MSPREVEPSGGNRRVTAKDIAASLGVSRATVGFVLNNTPGQSISAATRSRVFEEARRLGYRPHTAARALASGRTNVVLLLLPDWPVDFTMRRNIEEASRVLDEAGYALITSTPHQAGRARPLWETLQPDAVMSYLPLSHDMAGAMREAGVRRLIPDPDLDAGATGFSERGAELQVEHLSGLGHRILAYAGSADPRLAELSQMRWHTAQVTAGAAGLDISIARIGIGDDSAEEAVRYWLHAGVTGVLCYNDDVAAAITGAAIDLGVKIPDQLSVIGHDDAPIASLYRPRLSTVRLDAAGLGRLLADLTIARIEGGPVGDYGPLSSSVELVARETTARAAMDRARPGQGSLDG